MLSTHKYPQCCKEDKTVMLPKSVVNEEEKNKPELLLEISQIIYRKLMQNIIVELFQSNKKVSLKM
jgi:predicted HTH domain antitoxin